MYKGYSDDITWCSNRRCKRMKCYRNSKHIRKDISPYKPLSFANFEGTQYCLKEKERVSND